MNYKKLLEDNKILNGELGFSGVYSCLSNFHTHNPITIRLPFDKPYSYEFASNNIETLFQAAKTTNLHQIKQVVACSSPGQAKRLGRKVKLREDWEEIKEKVMFDLILAKFESCKEFRDTLINSDQDKYIVEMNSWGDKEWGVSTKDFCGNNKLGKLLMKLRRLYNINAVM